VLTAAKNHAFLHVLLRIDPRKLSLEGPLMNRSAIVHLLVRAYGVSGAEMEGGIDQRLRVSLNEEGYDRAMKNGLVYATTVPVSKPGPYVVRAALLDEAREELGTANQFIMVPNVANGRLAISGLLFASSLAIQNDVTPAAQPRTVAPGEHAFFVLEVLNASAKATLLMRMRLFREGRPIWEGAEAPLQLGGKLVAGKVLAKAELVVPAETAVGEYLLQVEVTDASKTGKGAAVAVQWVRVEVR
jgi:hypothetical protein